MIETKRECIRSGRRILEGYCELLQTILSGHPDRLPHFLPLQLMFMPTPSPSPTSGPSSTNHHPTSIHRIQTGRGKRPQINSSGGAKAHTKTNPTSEGWGLLLQSKRKNQPYKTGTKMSSFNSIYHPPAPRTPRKARSKGTEGGKKQRSLPVSTPSPESAPRQQQPQRVSRCNQRAGERENGAFVGRSKRNSKRRRKSDTYPHIAGSCTALPCVSVSAYQTRAQAAPGSNGHATGGAGAARAQAQSQRGVPGECGRGAGVRDLGDRLTEERYNACDAALRHDSFEKEGERGCIARAGSAGGVSQRVAKESSNSAE